MESNGQLGVILANTGSPSAPTPEAVRAYLQEFLTDPRIRPMHPTIWNIVLKAFILPKRSVASAEKYASIWTAAGSPLIASAQSLARTLESNLGEDTIVRCAMSYGEPSMSDALEELKSAGCERVVVIPLYPQSAFSTTEVVKDKLQSDLDALGWSPEVSFVQDYWRLDEYLNAIAASVRDAGFTEQDSLLLAFHSIPMKDVDAGDTYAEHAHKTASAIADRLGIAPERWRIGFQSRFDSRKWVSPFTRNALQELEEDLDDGRLFVVAPNFSIDCLETLHDIDVTLRQDFLAAHHSEQFVYVPCLNDSDSHARALEALIKKSLID